MDESEEVSLIDILVVMLRKRYLILGTTLAGLVLALAISFGGTLLHGGRGGGEATESRVVALVLEGDLGPIATASVGTKSFALALSSNFGKEVSTQDLERISVSYDPKSRLLEIRGRDSTDTSGLALAQAAYKALFKIVGASSSGRFEAMSEYITKEASMLALEDRSGEVFRGSQSELVAAANARSKRLVAEAYFNVTTMPGSGSDVSYKTLEAMVASYLEAEKVAVLALAVDESPAGTLSKASADALNAMVLTNLLREASLYHSIPREHNEFFKVVDEGPVESPKRDFVSRTLVLALVASLFLGLVLAFVANLWDGIRADPVAMAKLKGALERKRQKE